MHRSALSLLTAGLITIAVLTTSAAAGAAVPSHGPIGAFVGQNLSGSSSFTAWDKLEGQKPSGNVFETNIAWSEVPTLKTRWLHGIEQAGATPFVGIVCPQPAGCSMTNFHARAVRLAGIIGTTAKVYVAWLPEANNRSVYNGPAQRYKTQFRDLYAVLKHHDPNIDSVWQVTATEDAGYGSIWPGWSYVQLIGIDIFRTGKGQPLTTMPCPHQTTGHCLPDAVSAVEHGTIRAPSSKIFIASAGVTPVKGQRAQCAAYADLNSFSTNYHLFRNFIWFDRNAFTLTKPCVP